MGLCDVDEVLEVDEVAAEKAPDTKPELHSCHSSHFYLLGAVNVP